MGVARVLCEARSLDLVRRCERPRSINTPRPLSPPRGGRQTLVPKTGLVYTINNEGGGGDYDNGGEKATVKLPHLKQANIS